MRPAITRTYLPAAAVASICIAAVAACSSDSKSGSDGDGGTVSDGGGPGSGGSAPGTGGGAGTECPSGESLCSAQCVDLQSDLDNCGTCGNVCGAQQSCEAGTCQCAESLDECDGSCVDLASDPAHCGDCGTACADDQVCSQGGCADECADDLTDCSGACVDLQSSIKHCGSCENSCRGDQQCDEGSCGCSNGESECGGQCVDTSSSASHCGDCGVACGANERCAEGTCECADGYAACGSECVDTDSNNSHCGGCGEPCESGERCVSGDCEAIPAGQVPSGTWTPTSVKLPVQAAVVSGSRPDIAVGSDEMPLIAFTEPDAGKKGGLWFRRFTGSAWEEAAPELDVSDGSQGYGYAEEVRIEFDAQGRLVAVFSEKQSSGSCRFNTYARRLDEGHWQSLGTEAPLSKANCGQVGLAVDGNDVLAAWHSAVGDPRHVIVKRFSGSSWDPVGAAGKVPNPDRVVQEHELVVTENGTLFAGWSSGQNTLLARFSGDSWSQVHQHEPSIPSDWVGIAADGNDVLMVANSDQVYRYADGEAEALGGSLGLGNTDALMLRADGGVPVVVGKKDGNVVALGWNGSSWVSVGDPISDVHVCTAGAVSPAGRIWLVCQDSWQTSSSQPPPKLTVLELRP